MNKLFISILLAAVVITGAATLINTSKDSPAISVRTTSWTEDVLNISILSNQSESIIIGHVMEILPSKWNTQDGKKPVSTGKIPASLKEFYEKENEKNIYTDIIIKVDKKIKNESTPAVLIVRILGGQVGEDKMLVEDEAKFEIGENVLLFLTEEDPDTDNSAGTHYRISGMKHGKFSITDDNQAVRSDVPPEYQTIYLEKLLNSIGAQ